MRKLTVILGILLLMASCKQKHTTGNNIPTVGDFDPSYIAQDTTGQKEIETTAEYHKDLILNSDSVFDVVSFTYKTGNTFRQKFVVMLRTKTKYNDTIISNDEVGEVKNSFLGDVDNDGKQEIIVAAKPVASKHLLQLFIYKCGKQGNWEQLYFTENDLGGSSGKGDEFYMAKNSLVHRFPYYKNAGDTISKGKKEVYLKLVGAQLITKKTNLTNKP